VKGDIAGVVATGDDGVLCVALPLVVEVTVVNELVLVSDGKVDVAVLLDMGLNKSV